MPISAFDPNSKFEPRTGVRVATDLPPSAINELIDSILTPHDAERLKLVLAIAEKFDDTSIQVAVHPHNPLVPVALGYVTKSMHDYSHWGVNLAAVSPGFETSTQVKSLVASLIDFARNKKDEVVIDLERDPSGRTVDRYPAPSFALSTGTQFPELFLEHKFQIVHVHQNHQGENISWMMSVPNEPNVDTYLVPFSTPRITPHRSDSVYELNSDELITAGKNVIVRHQEWGAECGELFKSEMEIFSQMPGSAAFGVEVDNQIRGVGVIIKALHHPEAWSRAWIVVDEEYRGQGLAERLIRGMLFHADQHHARFSDGPMVMEGATYIPEYYIKYGNQPVAIRAESPDHKAFAWTMRITDPLNSQK